MREATETPMMELTLTMLEPGFRWGIAARVMANVPLRFVATSSKRPLGGDGGVGDGGAGGMEGGGGICGGEIGGTGGGIGDGGSAGGKFASIS